MKTVLSIAAAGLLLASLNAGAAVITNTPSNAQAAGVAQTSPFGTLAVGGAVGTALTGFGVDYSFGNVEGYFSDVPELAYCGIGAANACNLLTSVDGRIVVPNSTTQGLTSFVQVVAGFFAVPSNGVLRAFDINHNLLEQAVGAGPVVVSGSLLTISISRASADIAFFEVATLNSDPFGVRSVAIETPVAVRAAVPEPISLALLGIGLAGLCLSRRKVA